MRSRIPIVLISALGTTTAVAHEGLQSHGWLHDILHRVGAANWVLVAVLGAFLVATAAVGYVAWRVQRRATGQSLAVPPAHEP